MQNGSFQKRVGIFSATPADPKIGSGCAVAVDNLARGLRKLGSNVDVIRPRWRAPNFTLKRLLFNERLRHGDFHGYDLTIGVDADGYQRADKKPPHVANIKGVVGDAAPFERGWTRLSMEFQAGLEARHVTRADKVITTSQYCADQLRMRYGFTGPAAVVPEAIDLKAWSTLFSKHGTEPDPERFTVLCVCRLYPRKKVDVLLRAAAVVRRRAPELRLRIVGDGPEKERLQRIWRREELQDAVDWVGSIPRHRLARELTAAHAFCLPSVQEGFGIAFLEAMAAGLPIVAARAAAVPEVAPHALLAAPDDVQSLAEALLALYESRELRERIGSAGRERVEQYSLPVVSEKFACECEEIVSPR